MSSISISDLNPTGSELFVDPETYLKELTDYEQIRGGILPTTHQQNNASTYVCSDCLSITHRPTITVSQISW